MSIERFGLDPNEKLGLNKDDVVSLPNNSFGLERMTKLDALLKMLERWANTSNKVDEGTWFTEQGCQCEMLRIAGGGWQKGRFRIRLEFIPDNPEAFEKKPPSDVNGSKSAVDDLRDQVLGLTEFK